MATPEIILADQAATEIIETGNLRKKKLRSPIEAHPAADASGHNEVTYTDESLDAFRDKLSAMSPEERERAKEQNPELTAALIERMSKRGDILKQDEAKRADFRDSSSLAFSKHTANRVGAVLKFIDENSSLQQNARLGDSPGANPMALPPHDIVDEESGDKTASGENNDGLSPDTHLPKSA